METRLRILLLTLACTLVGGCASVRWPWRGDAPVQAPEVRAEEAEADAPPVVIEPQVERRRVTVPKIDTENFGVGFYFGEISIEDFTAVPLIGLRADYHITEDFFFEAAYGKAEAGKTSFETLGGNVQLLTDDERQFTYYNLSLGYNLLPGEVFAGRSRTMTSALYLLGGVGSVKFAGEQNFTVSFGAGFRVLPTDWLAIHIEAQDLVFKSDLLGVDRLKNNLQAHLGVTFFF